MTNLLDYVPAYLKEYKTLSDILNEQNIMLNQMEKDTLFLIENSFVLTANDFGLKRFETMLNIKPYSYDTFEIRRQRILNKLDTKIPYTLDVLKKKIESIVGENYILELEYDEYLLKIITDINIMEEGNLISEVLEDYVPVNVIINSITNLYYASLGKLSIANALSMTKIYFIK